MSIEAINWALKQPGSPTQKHVLLVLANYANEEGESFPSTVKLCTETGLSERAIRQARHDLIASGFVEKSNTYTRSGVRFVLTKAAPPAGKEANPADYKAAPHAGKAAAPAGKTAPDAAPYNHYITTNNHNTPHKPPKLKKSPPKFTPPDWVPREAWQGWLEMRRSKKKPATPRAMELAVKKLDDLRRQGQDPGEVLDNCTLHNWQGIFPLKKNGSMANVVPLNAPRHRPLSPPSNPFSGLGDDFDEDIPELTPEQKAAYYRYGGHA